MMIQKLKFFFFNKTTYFWIYFLNVYFGLFLGYYNTLTDIKLNNLLGILAHFVYQIVI